MVKFQKSTIILLVQSLRNYYLFILHRVHSLQFHFPQSDYPCICLTISIFWYFVQWDICYQLYRALIRANYWTDIRVFIHSLLLNMESIEKKKKKAKMRLKLFHICQLTSKTLIFINHTLEFRNLLNLWMVMSPIPNGKPASQPDLYRFWGNFFNRLLNG